MCARRRLCAELEGQEGLISRIRRKVLEVLIHREIRTLVLVQEALHREAGTVGRLSTTLAQVAILDMLRSVLLN